MFINRNFTNCKLFSRSLCKNIAWHQTHSIYLFFYNSCCWNNGFVTTRYDFTSRKKFFNFQDTVSIRNQFFRQ